MLPSLRSLKDARLDVHKRVSALNAHRPIKTHTRVYTTGPKAGTTRTVARYGPRVICDGAKTTLVEVLLPRARAAAQQMLATPLLWDQLVTDTGLLSPRIEVNGHELGEARDVCDRTTRNHLRQLKAHSFITAYKFRGREHSFYLWVNPALVWEMPVESPKTALSADSKSTLNPSDLSTNGKYFPPTEVLETLETQIRKVVPVDKSALQPGQEPTGTPLLEPQGHRDGAADAGQASKSRHRGRAAARAAQQAAAPEPSAEAQQTARVDRFVVEFWTMAKLLLYPTHHFTEAEKQKILRAIWQGQYKPALTAAAPAKWDLVHRYLLDRLVLVREYVQRHPDPQECYLPLPYAMVHRGRGYFDAENEKGFAGTRLWLAKKQNRPKGGLTALDRALQLAETELRQRQSLDRGEKVPASDRAKRKDILALHWYHRTEVKRIGGEEGLYLYHARLSMLGLATTMAVGAEA
ncbi:hypothetical protein [Hymenobacter chitinivorans]|uniref:Uncharacterized protein n=1 Tax=Hymenobacter chitinivorans DSM 11115 TaxID=1121954 RepID=A0A2M9BN90_9BACT|nr:hypothetical protein [Hymenobacter chitinivorans]PJJ59419.1 hypothetical protein CLV45_0836 [Hymenobacter chitinivorans DSM 11115]